MDHFRKTAIAAAVSGIAAAFLVSAPAYAHKVNDNLEANVKVFANWVSVDGNTAGTLGGQPATGSQIDDRNSGFHFDRAYFEGRYHADDNNMVRVTLDQKAPDGSVFVKYAYWQHKFANGVKTKVGQNHTPLVDYLQTEMWGHRYIQKTFTDAVGAQTSSDLGVSVLGSAGDQVDYYVSLMNGEGYTHTTDGAGYAFSGRVEFHTAGAHVGLFGQSESDRAGNKNVDPQREVVYAWWENEQFRVGGQYLMADDGNKANAGVNFDKGKGYNILANVKLPMGTKTSAFARYDTIDALDTGTDATLTIVGVESEFAPGVMLALDYQSADPGTTNSDSVNTFGIHGQFKY